MPRYHHSHRYHQLRYQKTLSCHICHVVRKARAQKRSSLPASRDKWFCVTFGQGLQITWHGKVYKKAGLVKRFRVRILIIGGVRKGVLCCFRKTLKHCQHCNEPFHHSNKKNKVSLLRIKRRRKSATFLQMNPLSTI